MVGKECIMNEMNQTNKYPIENQPFVSMLQKVAYHNSNDKVAQKMKSRRYDMACRI